MLNWFYAFEKFILTKNKKVVKALDLETISSDFFYGEKLNYELVLFWFCLLTFNLSKDNFTALVTS